MTDDSSELNAIELATELTIAWLNNGNNRVAAEDVPAFLQTMHATVLGLASGTSEPEEAAPQQDHVAAVSVRKSLASKDHIISMIDGKPYKTLRRHLAGHGLTPETYRERYGLRPDYPMVAETYSQSRRDMAKRIGLGRKARTTSEAGDAAGDAAPRRGRKPKAAE
ncbi:MULTISPECIES: MucR family transcriptional regulator [unclassified Sphingomonas]|jgi:predicted transcriptional regulator|uniref:MucR family transcriptional regulator n=1 Tax=unclassified Sphingomonas TaxID=196159 RepID=UPI0006F33A26|nr:MULTISPECIES: MucR family transcriptional regulator [unclassified Sphingomonas]KQM26646.1 transcriptional regulator [Sphingomonas sp. Leaf9]KQM43052.1 transcriptional regulator [Sphingomonas sp. Leaf11]KQM86977.1 transcriptional regulator [Sphingomonas sp. Leaf23]